MPDSTSLPQTVSYRLRSVARSFAGGVRRTYWSAQGMQIGTGTALPRIAVTWPHQVAIGARCVLEPDLYFKWDGIWAPGPRIRIGDRVFLGRACEFNAQVGIEIGDDSSIASGCKFVDHDHGTVRDDRRPARSLGCDRAREACVARGECGRPARSDDRLRRSGRRRCRGHQIDPSAGNLGRRPRAPSPNQGVGSPPPRG